MSKANFVVSRKKCCGFCKSEEITPLDYVGTGVTYMCRKCSNFTFHQPPLGPFPWGSLVITIIIIWFFIWVL